MNITRFNSGRDCFALAERLDACFDFKTETSIAFQIGRQGKSGLVSVVLGWLDVHHPVQADGFTKACLRVSLPEEYLNFEQMKQVTETVLLALEIPPDVIFEGTFFSTSKVTGYSADEPGVMYSYRVGENTQPINHESGITREVS